MIYYFNHRKFNLLLNRSFIALFIITICLYLPACSDEPQAPPNPTPIWVTDYDAESFGWVMSVVSISDSEAWISGGNPDQGKLFQLSNNTWNKVELPTEVPLLNWIHRSTDGMVVVGNNGTILHKEIGKDWEKKFSPTTQDLWGVWGPSINKLWAVGGTVTSSTGHATLIQFDGTQWTEVVIPTLQHTGVHAFFKIWGSDENNIYIVGQNGVVLSFDGNTWTEQFVGASQDLVTVFGTAKNRVVMVGGRGNGQAVTFDGKNFKHYNLPGIAGINGVWMNKETVFVGGESGTLGTFDFNTGKVTEEESNTSLTFHALHGHFSDKAGYDVVRAVGGSLYSVDPPFRGVSKIRIKPTPFE